MQTAANHLTELELEQGLDDVLASPRTTGRLEGIIIRPASNERCRLASAQVSAEGGLEGDRWATEQPDYTDDGKPDSRSQISLMNARFLRQIAGDDDSMCLAGDNLLVDFDLSAENAPAGCRLAVGNTVVIEISDQSHTGCSKLEARYGANARAFMNAKSRKELHLRGRYARTIVGGTIAVGDTIRKLTA